LAELQSRLLAFHLGLRLCDHREIVVRAIDELTLETVLRIARLGFHFKTDRPAAFTVLVVYRDRKLYRSFSANLLDRPLLELVPPGYYVAHFGYLPVHAHVLRHHIPTVIVRAAESGRYQVTPFVTLNPIHFVEPRKTVKTRPRKTRLVCNTHQFDGYGFDIFA